MKERINKYKVLFVVSIIVLVGLYIGLIISNFYLQKQLDKKDEIIKSLTSTNDFYSNYLDVVETDSTSCVVLHLDKQGNRQTYKDLSKEVERLERELEIKDRIIVLAKHKYNFNYSYKMEGDSLFIYSFWSKDK